MVSRRNTSTFLLLIIPFVFLFVYLFWCVLKIPFTWAHTGCVGVITATGKSAGLESLVSLWIHHISLGQKRRFLIKRINAIPIENKMKYNNLFPAFWILYCFFMLTLMPGLHLPDLFCLLGHTHPLVIALRQIYNIQIVKWLTKILYYR